MGKEKSQFVVCALAQIKELCPDLGHDEKIFFEKELSKIEARLEKKKKLRRYYNEISECDSVPASQVKGFGPDDNFRIPKRFLKRRKIDRAVYKMLIPETSKGLSIRTVYWFFHGHISAFDYDKMELKNIVPVKILS